MFRRTAAALAAALLVVSLSACTSEEVQKMPADLQPIDDGRVVEPVTGSATIAFDSAFLDDLGNRVAPSGSASGSASGSGGTVRLRVVTGQLVASSTELNGAVVLSGSTVSFPEAGADVRLTDLVLDLAAGTAAGVVSVGGRPLSDATLLMELDLGAAKRPTPDTDEAVRLTGVRLQVSQKLATLVDRALQRDALTAGDPAGTLSLTIDRA